MDAKIRIDPSRNGWAVEKLSAKSSMNLNFQSSVRTRPAQGEKKSEVDWRALDLITLLQIIWDDEDIMESSGKFRSIFRILLPSTS